MTDSGCSCPASQPSMQLALGVLYFFRGRVDGWRCKRPRSSAAARVLVHTRFAGRVGHGPTCVSCDMGCCLKAVCGIVPASWSARSKSAGRGRALGGRALRDPCGYQDRCRMSCA